jgi:hypothetical protein
MMVIKTSSQWNFASFVSRLIDWERDGASEIVIDLSICWCVENFRSIDFYGEDEPLDM